MRIDTHIQTDIQQMIGIDAEQYAVMVEQIGYNYAKAYCAGDTQMISWMTGTKMYWTWFKQQWMIVDRAFASSFRVSDGTPDVKESLRMMWLDEHQQEAMKLFPPRHVIHALRETMMQERKSFSDMVDEFIKSINTPKEPA